MAQSLEEELQQFAEHDIPLAEFHSFTRKTERLDEEEDRSYFRQLQELEEKYSSADVYTPKVRPPAACRVPFFFFALVFFCLFFFCSRFLVHLCRGDFLCAA